LLEGNDTYPSTVNPACRPASVNRQLFRTLITSTKLYPYVTYRSF
jgi:hypothetical protein